MTIFKYFCGSQAVKKTVVKTVGKSNRKRIWKKRPTWNTLTHTHIHMEHEQRPKINLTVEELETEILREAPTREEQKWLNRQRDKVKDMI